MAGDHYQIFTQIIAGFKDIQEGRYYEITGDWQKDKASIMYENEVINKV